MSYDLQFEKLKQWEAKKSIDRKDTGNYTPEGEFLGTYVGVSAKTHPDLVRMLSNMTYEQQLSFLKPWYKEQYWVPAKCDLYPTPVQFVTFAAAVLSGPLRTRKWVQKAAKVKADGVIGPKSKAAIDSMHPIALTLEFNVQRIMDMDDFATWETHDHGWLRRIQDIQYTAISHYIARNSFSLDRLL